MQFLSYLSSNILNSRHFEKKYRKKYYFSGIRSLGFKAMYQISFYNIELFTNKKCCVNKQNGGCTGNGYKFRKFLT